MLPAVSGPGGSPGRGCPRPGHTQHRSRHACWPTATAWHCPTATAQRCRTRWAPPIRPSCSPACPPTSWPSEPGCPPGSWTPSCRRSATHREPGQPGQRRRKSSSCLDASAQQVPGPRQLTGSLPPPGQEHGHQSRHRRQQTARHQRNAKTRPADNRNDDGAAVAEHDEDAPEEHVPLRPVLVIIPLGHAHPTTGRSGWSPGNTIG